MLTGTSTFSNRVFDLNNFLKKQLFEKLLNIQGGYLTINDEQGMYRFGDKTSDLAAELTISDMNFYQMIAFGGSVGSGEAYMDQMWEVDDLTRLIRIMVRNQDILDDMEGGSASIKSIVMKFLHFFRKNTKGGSRRNIAAHYDLGNEFFRLFLDKRLMYSSAVYDEHHSDLESASEYKLDEICRKLNLSENDRVLEIGSGWGGFSIYAAQNYGCHVTTVTISQEQYKEACLRIEAEGLQDLIDIRLCDYRDIEGQFDKLVSIEMVEAVGHQFLDLFFQRCSHLLKRNGSMLLQAITIQNDRYEQALHSVDFIKRYIFPGSFIPCTDVLNASANKSGLYSKQSDDIGLSYALTLKAWREAFLKNTQNIIEQGYSLSFVRMWLFYFCYCEGGFLERSISNVQILFQKKI